MAPPEMDSRAATTKESLHLPEEIIGEILARLRVVKPLLRFRCVSKSWLSLIDSKGFIQTHHKVLISYGSKPKQCSLSALLESEETPLTDLSPLGHLISPGFPFYASYCSGLLCVYQSGRFLLLNPSTRVSKELPKDPERDIISPKFGFGWDESSGAYKVFAGWHDGRLGKGRVYSSKTNSWKTVEELPYLAHEGNKDGKFVGGKLHWLGKNNEIISSFDLKTETFGTIELPVGMKGEGRCFVELGVIGGCLCLSAEYYDKPGNPFDVWVMKEYGVKESWEKLPTIHLAHEIPDCRHFPHCARVMGESANGEILIACNLDFLVIYCPRKGVVRRGRDFGYCFKELYVESLVSPVD